MSERGPARAEDDLWGDVSVELGLERGGELDLAQDSEPLLGQGGPGRLQGTFERLVDGGGQA